MNYDKPLKELQRIKKRNFHFLDSSIFGVILSKDANMETFKARIREELYKTWPRLITFHLYFLYLFYRYIKFPGNGNLKGDLDSTFRIYS